MYLEVCFVELGAVWQNWLELDFVLGLRLARARCVEMRLDGACLPGSCERQVRHGGANRLTKRNTVPILYLSRRLLLYGVL